jgi:hypothetical protein
VISAPLPVPAFAAAAEAAAAPAPKRTSEDWEAMLGGNWFAKLAALVVVIGIALVLGYEFTHIGPAGIVAISLAGSSAMLLAGAVFEPRERYRILARALISGGWAGLYVTVYSMHVVAAAKVIDDPYKAGVLLIAVAVGMIVHSLKYRSEIVTGLVYFIAFFTLVITQITSLSLIALIPLAASILFIANHFRWSRMALGGLVATYVTVALRPDNGAPLWEAQAIFTAYWLLFEVFDILQADTWLLPLNAVGFLGLSLIKWQRADPGHMWRLLAAVAAAYLLSALLRARRGRWQGAAFLTAGLAAAAIFQRLDHQWVASALVVEAEIFYLAGLRLRSSYLRWLGTGLFFLEACRLVADIGVLPVDTWAPVAALDAVVFYANRFLCPADLFYGYAGAAALALAAGFKAPGQYRGCWWLAPAAVAFAFGWWRRLADIRLQGYLLWALGLIGVEWSLGKVPLSSAAALSYALALTALWSKDDRMGPEERDALRFLGSLAATAALATLAWRVVDGGYLGIVWIGLGVVLMELGIFGRPKEVRRFALALGALGAGRMLIHDIIPLENHGLWIPRLLPAIAAAPAYWIAYRSRRAERMVTPVAAWTGTGFVAVSIWAVLPQHAVPTGWELFSLALFAFGWWWRLPVIRLQGYLLWGLGMIGLEWGLEALPLSSIAVASYTLALAALWSKDERMGREERDAIRLLGSLAAIAALATLAWRVVDGAYLGIVWIALGAVLMELGIFGWPGEVRRIALALAALGAGRVLIDDIIPLGNHGLWIPRLLPAAAALPTYWIAYRSRRAERMLMPVAAWTGTAFLAVSMWAVLPHDAVAAAWALYSLALLAAGFRWKQPQIGVLSCALAAVAYWWWVVDFLTPRSTTALPLSALAGCAGTIACYYAAQLLAPRGHIIRLYASLLATTLTALLLYEEVSGRMLTISWGIQGAALLAAGFALGDKIPRLSGLLLLLVCILKLFCYDLGYLEPLPRAFSFLVLGLILMGVSWVYSRFRERFTGDR